MLEHFLKYQSLGNDFIIFDWYKKSEPAINCALTDAGWKDFVINMCKRQEGVGADCVLILKSDRQHFLPEILVFNADGSRAENCMNGLRCIAHYLFTHYAYPSEFSIKIGQNAVDFRIEKKDKTIEIITILDFVHYQGRLTIKTDCGVFAGYQASAGNPHFIIFQETSVAWLQQYGSMLEQHEVFPGKTNVEFVYELDQQQQKMLPKKYQLLVYERGCGITRACSSGASAVLATLFQNKLIETEEPVELMMLGGSVLGWIDIQGRVVLQASASFVFSGDFQEPERMKSIDVQTRF